MRLVQVAAACVVVESVIVTTIVGLDTTGTVWSKTVITPPGDGPIESAWRHLDSPKDLTPPL